MRWIVISLVVINILVLIWQLASGDVAPPPSPVKPRMTDDVPNLKLLSELEEETLQSMLVNRERLRLDQTPPPQNEPLCTLIGPFEKLLRAEYFVERLEALDVASKVQEVEIPGEVNYWVYLPPLGSRKAAFDKLREIQSKSIDSYVIPRGDLENAISFGVFSQKNLADERLRAMQAQGYEAKIIERERSYKEVWVVLEPGQNQALAPESWQNLMANESQLERRQNYCPAVASE